MYFGLDPLNITIQLENHVTIFSIYLTFICFKPLLYILIHEIKLYILLANNLKLFRAIKYPIQQYIDSSKMVIHRSDRFGDCYRCCVSPEKKEHKLNYHRRLSIGF